MVFIKYGTQMEVLGPELQLHPSPWFVSCGTDSLDVCINITMIWVLRSLKGLVVVQRKAMLWCVASVLEKEGNFKWSSQNTPWTTKWRGTLRTA